MTQRLDPKFEISVERIMVGCQANLPERFQDPPDDEVRATIKRLNTKDERIVAWEEIMAQPADQLDVRCWRVVSALSRDLNTFSDEVKADLKGGLTKSGVSTPELQSTVSPIVDRCFNWTIDNMGAAHVVLFAKTCFSVNRLPVNTQMMPSFARLSSLFQHFII